MLNKGLFLLVGLIFTTSCNENSKMESATVDFRKIQWYADRASSAYQSEQEIMDAFPDTVRVKTVGNTKVQYFLENPLNQNKQILSIRGTANVKNAIEDAEYLQVKNSKLGIYVDKGFDQDTALIYADVLPHLDKNKEIIITGHSLGAAISTLMMMYLHVDGFKVGDSVNFGQPKVTNGAGREKYHDLPLLRIIDENDLVPLLPPKSLLDSIHGQYTHIGPEVILLEGLYYVYQDEHLQRETDSISFWSNLRDLSVKAHFIKHYQHNIDSKLATSKQIPYDQRKQYIDN